MFKSLYGLSSGADNKEIFYTRSICSQVNHTYARKVFDVTGAGDTVIAAIALELASGLDLVKSFMLTNFAAGVVVSKVGCVPCEIPELNEYIKSVHAEP